jgi:hypothetical protein
MRRTMLETLIWIAFLVPPAVAGTGTIATRGPQASGRRIDPALAEDLRSRGDPGLDALRAGRVDAPRLPPIDERLALREAEAGNAALLDLRAGDGVTTVLIIGLVVLLIILIA